MAACLNGMPISLIPELGRKPKFDMLFLAVHLRHFDGGDTAQRLDHMLDQRFRAEAPAVRPTDFFPTSHAGSSSLPSAIK